ncbi:hypothetical protein [Streptomyces sp. NPDC052114]|uniref:hypothetical protein n=1 Tax=unclassified Streptomyces TaxID=2593676 RepID=UPI00341C84AC
MRLAGTASHAPQNAFDRLAPNGTLVSVGHTGGDDEHFPHGALFGDGGRHNRTLATFYLLDCPDLGPDLTWLAAGIAAGDLDAGQAWRGAWEKAPEAVDVLLDRRLHGKAILDIA